MANLAQISGIGLCSSLGGYQDACAAYRVGLNRFSANEAFQFCPGGSEEPTPLTVAPVNNLFMYHGIARIIKMLELAYRDLNVNRGAAQKNALPSEGAAIFLATPDPDDRNIELGVSSEVERNERLQYYIDRITRPLFNKVNPELNKVPVQAVFGERTAFARIFQKALEALQAGTASYCLLLVADSLLGDESIEAQLSNQRLKTPDNPVGYIPGEGAAVFLLSKPQGQGLQARFSVGLDKETVDPDNEEQTLDLWQGAKLNAVIDTFVQTTTYLPQFVLDLNGEEKRAIEFAMLQLHLKSRALKESPGNQQAAPAQEMREPLLPALSFGDTGTMVGPLALCSIVASVQRGYAKTRDFLVSMSEDSGKRAVIRAQF